MLPGRTLTPAGIAALAWRFKWLILALCVLGASAAAVYSSRLPNQYQSETTILVVPQRVPESFVRSTVTIAIADRLRTVSQQILSRPSLEQIVRDFNLYPEQRRTQPLDDVITSMRDSIDITVVRGDSFRVAFTYTEAAMAAKVADRLARDVITSNTRDRQSQAEGTSQFLEAQLEDARRRLVEQEKRREEYSRQHAGALPSQLQSNLQVIQHSQQQLQNLQESVNRDRDRRLVVDRLLADLSLAEQAPPVVQAPTGPITQLPTARQLEVARQVVTELQSRGLTPDHPDLRSAQRRVVDLAEKVKQEQAARPGTPPAPVTVADASRRNQVIQLTAERDNLDRQIAAKLAEDTRLRSVIDQYQVRIESLPTRESELTEINRDYETIQTTYRTLLSKKEESLIATNLESRQIGEQFRIVDPARNPERAISPNRLLINAGGAAAGLLLAIGLIGLVEVRDSSLKTEDDVLDVLELPVLACVPVVRTAGDLAQLRRRKRWTLFLTGVAGAITVGVVALVWKGGL
jgi:polysaccharide chain length determinant protein (PEP-CTERM system associated)